MEFSFSLSYTFSTFCRSLFMCTFVPVLVWFYISTCFGIKLFDFFLDRFIKTDVNDTDNCIFCHRFNSVFPLYAFPYS
jgi:hypothetical protein